MRRRARDRNSSAHAPVVQQRPMQDAYETINEGPVLAPRQQQRPVQANPYEIVDDEEPIAIDIRPGASRSRV